LSEIFKIINIYSNFTGYFSAGVYFENTQKTVRLDSNDAEFVDVIHTDAQSSLKFGLGMMQKLGHVDFYPNG
jgi:pancreatic triacylglycerol lipase